MAITQELAYSKPTTIEEAIGLLRERPGASLLAGGTDLVAWMRDGLVEPETIVDLKGIDSLHGVDRTADGLRIGALATFSDLEYAPPVREGWPVVSEMAAMVASVGIRNRATLVGNICSAVPSCDGGPVLLALEADVHVLGPEGARTIAIDRWFTGPHRTDLRDGEVVTHLFVPAAEHGAAFARLTRYRGEDLAQASVAVAALRDGSFRVAFGAVAPTPMRAHPIEELLDGRSVDEGLVERAADLVPEAISPITDLRATARYRTRMCQVMLVRALRAAADRREGGGPPMGTRLM